MKRAGAIGGSVFGAVGDMFSGALFGQVILGVFVALGLVAAATFAVITYGVPLIPQDDTAGLGWLWGVLRWVASFGAVLIALFLVPPVTMFVGGLFFAGVKKQIETKRLGVAPTGGTSALGSAGAAVRVSMPSFITNLAFLPAWAIPVLNVIGFIIINAIVSGRAYFDLAAGDQAKALKRAHPVSIFFAGVPIAIMMAIPAVQFLAPTYGAAVMTRLRHRIDPTLSAPAAPPGSAPPPRR